MAFELRRFGQWDIILDIAKFVVPTVGSVYTSYYTGEVSKDIAEQQIESSQRIAEINAALKRFEIEKIYGAQVASQEASLIPSGEIAGIPTWMLLVGGLGLILVMRR